VWKHHIFIETMKRIVKLEERPIAGNGGGRAGPSGEEGGPPSQAQAILVPQMQQQYCGYAPGGYMDPGQPMGQQQQMM